MEILSLDLATAAGWASKILGRRSGVIEFQLKRGESPGMRFLRCRAWLNELQRRFRHLQQSTESTRPIG